jgi:hypothetical protein
LRLSAGARGRTRNENPPRDWDVARGKFLHFFITSPPPTADHNGIDVSGDISNVSEVFIGNSLDGLPIEPHDAGDRKFPNDQRSAKAPAVKAAAATKKTPISAT